MNEDEIRAIIQDELGKGQYGVAKTPYHRHTGVDSPQVDIQDITRFDSKPSTGDLTYWNGLKWVSLPIGISGYVVASNGSIPTYVSAGGGGGSNAVGVAQAFHGEFSLWGIPDSTPQQIIQNNGADHFFVCLTNSGSADITGDTSSGSFTINTSGWYLILATMSYGGTAGTTATDFEYRCSIYLNGSAFITGTSQSSINDGFISCSISTVIPVDVEDDGTSSIQLYAWQNSGIVQYLGDPNGGYFAQLMVTKIGTGF